jgi:ribonuclease HI
MSENNKVTKEVSLYTDGGCLDNPGRGGWGVVLLFGKHRKELSGGYQLTTNNRMELMAAIQGLEALKEPCKVRLYSDSRYVVDGITHGWAKRWQKNNWWRTKKKKALNPDLWERLLGLCEKHLVEFIWVKGHTGNRENERCDVLSQQAALAKNNPEDPGYDPENNPGKVKITQEGQPCRKCSTPVIKVKGKPNWRKKKSNHYYAYYFYCPACKTIYTNESWKKDFKEEPPDQLHFINSDVD